jgi:hypothetical protein
MGSICSELRQQPRGIADKRAYQEEQALSRCWEKGRQHVHRPAWEGGSCDEWALATAFISWCCRCAVRAVLVVPRPAHSTGLLRKR